MDKGGDILEALATAVPGCSRSVTQQGGPITFDILFEGRSFSFYWDGDWFVRNEQGIPVKGWSVPQIVEEARGRLWEPFLKERRDAGSAAWMACSPEHQAKVIDEIEDLNWAFDESGMKALRSAVDFLRAFTERGR